VRSVPRRRSLGAPERPSARPAVRFHAGSLLEPLPERYRERVGVIVANVPYVPPTLWGARHRDPTGTILGAGADGLELQRALVWQATGFLRPGGVLVLQLAYDQWPVLAGELAALGYVEPTTVGGLAGDVLVSVRLP
jgi:release factor glutamine methyltransferase